MKAKKPVPAPKFDIKWRKAEDFYFYKFPKSFSALILTKNLNDEIDVVSVFSWGNKIVCDAPLADFEGKQLDDSKFKQFAIIELRNDNPKKN